MKKKLVASVLCLSMVAASLAGCGGSDGKKADTSESKDKESSKGKVELTIWDTSRNKDDWYTSMEKKFLEEHPDITLNKVVKEGGSRKRILSGCRIWHCAGSCKLLFHNDGLLHFCRHFGTSEQIHR